MTDPMDTVMVVDLGCPCWVLVEGCYWVVYCFKDTVRNSVGVNINLELAHGDFRSSGRDGKESLGGIEFMLEPPCTDSCTNFCLHTTSYL